MKKTNPKTIVYSMTKPNIPQGTRDFTSAVIRKRTYIFSVIRSIFERFAFEPLETPAMEYMETLTGKYGEEGDKLIFKILNNGLSNPQKAEKIREGFEKILTGRNSTEITERALKYDLTVPFARFVAMNHGQLTFPYKRYQIQPVWRADRPQKSRYREFTQCDADVVGSTSLYNEVEFAVIYHKVFSTLGIKGYELRINSRKILTALAGLCGGTEKISDITIAIDKIDKIGIDNVKAELEEKGLSNEQISVIEKYLLISGNNEEKLTQIGNILAENAVAQEAIHEISFILSNAKECNLVVDFTLARGLNYYTGIIFEAKAPASVKIGSIGGGGRYDNLTGLFGVTGIPGVGISFGVDRIYDVMEELKLFPKELEISVKAIFFNMGEKESAFAFDKMQELRNKGISCEMYHEFTKISKQFNYAEKKKIEYAVIIGSREIEQNYCLVKNLSTGVQEIVVFEKLDNYFGA